MTNEMYPTHPVLDYMAKALIEADAARSEKKTHAELESRTSIITQSAVAITDAVRYLTNLKRPRTANA